MSQPDKVTFRAVESVHPNSMLIRDTDKLEFVISFHDIVAIFATASYIKMKHKRRSKYYENE